MNFHFIAIGMRANPYTTCEYCSPGKNWTSISSLSEMCANHSTTGEFFVPKDGIEPTLLTTCLITFHALSRISGSNIKPSLAHSPLRIYLSTYSGNWSLNVVDSHWMFYCGRHFLASGHFLFIFSNFVAIGGIEPPPGIYYQHGSWDRWRPPLQFSGPGEFRNLDPMPNKHPLCPWATDPLSVFPDCRLTFSITFNAVRITGYDPVSHGLQPCAFTRLA